MLLEILQSKLVLWELLHQCISCKQPDSCDVLQNRFQTVGCGQSTNVNCSSSDASKLVLHKSKWYRWFGKSNIQLHFHIIYFNGNVISQCCDRVCSLLLVVSVWCWQSLREVKYDPVCKKCSCLLIIFLLCDWLNNLCTYYSLVPDLCSGTGMFRPCLNLSWKKAKEKIISNHTLERNRWQTSSQIRGRSFQMGKGISWVKLEIPKITNFRIPHFCCDA